MSEGPEAAGSTVHEGLTEGGLWSWRMGAKGSGQGDSEEDSRASLEG